MNPSIEERLTTLETLVAGLVEKMTVSRKKARGTLEEIKAYCAEIGLPESDGEDFHDRMLKQDWTVSKQPVKDWKATIRVWKRSGNFPSQKQQPQSQAKPVSASIVAMDLQRRINDLKVKRNAHKMKYFVDEAHDRRWEPPEARTLAASMREQQEQLEAELKKLTGV